MKSGSFVNDLYSRGVVGEPRPVVGMGATILAWTDRYAATITEVTEFGGSATWKYEIAVVRDVAKVVSGSSHDGTAEYEYSPGVGRPSYFRKNKKTGLWVSGYRNSDTGRWNSYKDGCGLRIGKREEYRDPCF